MLDNLRLYIFMRFCIFTTCNIHIQILIDINFYLYKICNDSYAHLETKI